MASYWFLLKLEDTVLFVQAALHQWPCKGHKLGGKTCIPQEHQPLPAAGAEPAADCAASHAPACTVMLHCLLSGQPPPAALCCCCPSLPPLHDVLPPLVDVILGHSTPPSELVCNRCCVRVHDAALEATDLLNFALFSKNPLQCLYMPKTTESS